MISLSRKKKTKLFHFSYHHTINIITCFFLFLISVAQIDSEGLGPVMEMLADLGSWPILKGDDWDRNMSVLDLIVKLNLYNNKILIDQWVAADDKDSEVNIIQVCTYSNIVN